MYYFDIIYYILYRCYRFNCCIAGLTLLTGRPVKECLLSWCSRIFGGGGDDMPAAFLIGLLGAELEFELVLLDELEFGLVVTVELDSVDEL